MPGPDLGGYPGPHLRIKIPSGTKECPWRVASPSRRLLRLFDNTGCVVSVVGLRLAPTGCMTLAESKRAPKVVAWPEPTFCGGAIRPLTQGNRRNRWQDSRPIRAFIVLSMRSLSTGLKSLSPPSYPYTVVPKGLLALP